MASALIRDGTSGTDAWFYHPVRRSRPRMRLFCFPHAGAGAAAYAAWSPALGEDVELWPVQPPGRQNRAGEPALDTMDDLVAAVLSAVTPLLDLPVALFGHSLGAHVAFELARALRAAGLPEPRVLYPSARRAPQLPDQNIQYSRLDDRTLIGAAGMILGHQGGADADASSVALALPALRADLRIADSYRYRPGPKLAADIVAFGGIDDPGVPAEDLAGWRAQTAGRFGMRLFPGGHFYPTQARTELVRAIADDLARIHGDNDG